MMLENLINNKNKVVIVSHQNPDGDAVGSVTAIYAFLNSLGVEAKMVLPNIYPDYLKFLDRDNNILIYDREKDIVDPIINDAELIMCLDFNSLSRTSDMVTVLKQSKAEKLLIDHHLNPDEEEFNLVISDTQVSSTCELVLKTLLDFDTVNGDVTKLPFEVLESLTSGMLTDTNNFKNSLFPFTFQMASMMMAQGVDFEYLNNTLFNAYSENRLRLMGEILHSNMVVNNEYKFAYIILTKELQDKYSYAIGDSEGFVNMPLLIDGVEISAFFKEVSDKIRVSLRSKGKYSVNALSKAYFNGGGHERASGGELYLRAGEVAEYCEEKIIEFIKAHDLIEAE